MQRIEILLSHKRVKNNYKNRDSLFPLVQCFKPTFCYILYNVSKLLFISFSSKFQDFSSLSHTKISLHFHSPFSLLLFYIHMPTAFHVMSSQIYSNKKQCHLLSSLQLYNDTYITSTLSYHFIITHMSRLRPRKGDRFLLLLLLLLSDGSLQF